MAPCGIEIFDLYIFNASKLQFYFENVHETYLYIHNVELTVMRILQQFQIEITTETHLCEVKRLFFVRIYSYTFDGYLRNIQATFITAV